MNAKSLYFEIIVIIFLLLPLMESNYAQHSKNSKGKPKALFGTSFNGSKQPVKLFTNQYHNAWATAPKDWMITGSRPQGDALDMSSKDKSMSAGYLVVGIQGNVANYSAYNSATPEDFLHNLLTESGKYEISYGEDTYDDFGYTWLPYEKSDHRITVKGVAVYRTWPVPNDPDGYIILIRTAQTLKQIWKNQGAQAIAVALSIRCKILQRQSYNNQTNGTNYNSGSGDIGLRNESAEDKFQSSYNRELGMEDAHDPDTGENFWLNPSTDWRENGPDGPGYYKENGNDLKKLSEGRSDD